MSRSFKDIEYTKVDLDSPRRGFQPGDTSVGLHDGDLDDENDDFNDDPAGSNRGPLLRESGSAAGGGAIADPGDPSAAGDKKPSVLSMAYYQRFFNVDTRQVGMRILGSFVPRPGRNFVADEIRPSPDIYGPFWVCTTLIFTTAIAGNLADYFQTASIVSNTGKGVYPWVYDFRKVTFAATAIYMYWWLLPLVLWSVSWWRQLPERLAFLELLCLYGYSLSIYIPVSVLCVVQYMWLQWLLVLIGLLTSGTVLAMSLWPSLVSGERRTALALLILVAVMHAALAVGFKLYFFSMSGNSAAGNSATTIGNSTTTGVSTAAVSTTKHT